VPPATPDWTVTWTWCTIATEGHFREKPARKTANVTIFTKKIFVKQTLD